MDTKAVIAKLVKIVGSQQKIINKLAQSLPTDIDRSEPFTPDPASPSNPDPPPGELKPNPTQKDAAKVILEALDPAVRQQIDKDKYGMIKFKEIDGEMHVGFKPGQVTRANFDAVLNTMKGLSKLRKLQKEYKLVLWKE